MKEHFVNTAYIKESTDGQNLQKIRTDCDMGFLKVHDAEQFSKLFSFVLSSSIKPPGRQLFVM